MKNHPLTAQWWLSILLCLLLPLTVPAFADDEEEEEEDATAEELAMQDVPVDERIFLKPWHEVPFKKEFFNYTDKELEEKWDELMVGIQAPFPSPSYLKYMIATYPWIVEGVDAYNGDVEDFSKKILHVWRLFIRGDFKEARTQGIELGPVGKIPGLFAQIMYAIYLADRQSEKYMLLQDVANQVSVYFDDIEKMGEDPVAIDTAAFIKLGYAYAIGRIAEESPVPVVIARNYIPKIKDTAETIILQVPQHPLAHAFRGGVDAGIMRRVGRVTGRITYGARSTNVGTSFDKAFELAPDIPVLNYEYANALLYTKRRRDLSEVFMYLEKATKFQPAFSMDALDTMYAFKRLQEVRLYEENYRSFRRFEHNRRRFARVTDHNLTNVLSPVLNMDMLKNPEQYRFED